MLSDEDEILDIVNENDEVIDIVSHAEAYNMAAGGHRYLRASNAFLVNSKGKLWIPRRQSHRKIAPNGLDYSMDEHVQSGESYLQAAVRGFAEELYMTIQPAELVLLGKWAPSPGLPPYFISTYLYYSDTEPNYNRDDFSSAAWLTAEEVLARLAAGDSGKASLPHSLKQLLAYQAQHSRDQ